MSQLSAVALHRAPIGFLCQVGAPTGTSWLYTGLGLLLGVALGVAAGIAWKRLRRARHEPVVELTPHEPHPTDLDIHRRYAERMSSLGVIAGSVAHDFNNVLTSILGNADLALEQIRGGSPLQTNVEAIHAAARRGAELCRQILAYSGQGSPHLETIDLSALIGSMEPLLEAALPKKIELRLMLASNAPPVEVDIVRVQQLVLCLVDRAVAAIDGEEGTITISTGARDCDEELLARSRLGETPKPGCFAFLEVIDSGRGLSAKRQGELFAPATPAENDRRLSSIPGIVRERRGAILVEGSPQHGTTVTILFPKVLESETTGGESEPEGDGFPWRGRGVALLADDEPAVLQVCTAMLERFGYVVVVARDGQEAVDLFAERGSRIDLVVLDLSMPHLDGVQALERIRALRPDVPAILTSGYDELYLTTHLERPGACAFIDKPFTTDKLRRKLQELTRSTAKPR